MERDINVNRQEGNLDTGTDIRRSMIMARDVTTAHPEMVENMGQGVPLVNEVMGRDLVSWGSIWGGAFVYLSVLAVLGGFAVSAGIMAGGRANATTGVVGLIVTAIIVFLSTVIGGFVGGWTSNERSLMPTLVNGLIFGAFVTTAPLLFVTAISSLAAGTAGAASVNTGVPFLGTGTLNPLGANLGWASLGILITWALAIYGYYSGMKAHLTDLNMPNAVVGRQTLNRQTLTRR